ncbi:murein transglycosylase A [Legionella impletisoli]|uniref:Membrane-bound lytic murein transglycosylase A n=1 Tax=Legionella impletisoli TaxID=343510 RepID=A0A917JLZ3_9GAMM|nr:MltA domain-containing protein [Legionella impletisoli]GGI76763.1 membrane-bound lytic murein transglycosylase A [Legionella impletisoli]
MRKKIVYSIILVLLILIVTVGLYLFKFKQPKPEIHLKEQSFNQLPGWETADLRPSLETFKVSCKAFLKQNPEKIVGSKFIELKVNDWQPICQAAMNVNPESNKEIKAFFETWFSPATFHTDEPVKGLFTGYYMPLVKGSLTKTDQFNVPVYGVPKDLISVDLGLFDSDLKHHRRLFGRVKENSLIPYYTRKEIRKGAIEGFAPTLAWIESPVDLQFLEIEGSGVIELENGEQIVIGYAAQNGQPYTSIAKVLIERGVLTKQNASMQGIRNYFKAHPEEINAVLNQNKSFVFFHRHSRVEALGSQGVPLTPGYSMAVDLKWVPIGTPLWLKTTRPDHKNKKKPLERLMIAQDTGGAIRGPVRGDLYWGTGDEAIFIAGHMKNMGYYWLLLPKTYFNHERKS